MCEREKHNWGSSGRRFKSCQPDYVYLRKLAYAGPCTYARHMRCALVAAQKVAETPAPAEGVDYVAAGSMMLAASQPGRLSNFCSAHRLTSVTRSARERRLSQSRAPGGGRNAQ
jgi:hypothetical protein